MRTFWLVAATALVFGAAGSRWPCPFFSRSPRAKLARELITDKHRAYALPVDEYMLAGLRIGDRVDVYVVFDAEYTRTRAKMAATLLQNVPVVGLMRSGDPKGKGAVYLGLNPNEVQYAALALKQSEVSIGLRKPGDVDKYPMEMALFAKLFR